MQHVVAVSGGKDSTALALLLSEREPRDYTYVCTPTGDELPEWFEHMRRRVIRMTHDEFLAYYALAIDRQVRRWMGRKKTATVREDVATGDMDCANAVGGPQSNNAR